MEGVLINKKQISKNLRGGPTPDIGGGGGIGTPEGNCGEGGLLLDTKHNQNTY